MASFNMEMEMVWQRRSAIYTPVINRPSLNLTRYVPVKCLVWGCFQVADGEDVNPYFVVELESGMCTYAGIEQVRFIEEEDECCR